MSPGKTLWETCLHKGIDSNWRTLFVSEHVFAPLFHPSSEHTLTTLTTFYKEGNSLFSWSLQGLFFMDEIIQESPHHFQEMVRQSWILTGRSNLPGLLYLVIYFEFWKHL